MQTEDWSTPAIESQVLKEEQEYRIYIIFKDYLLFL